MEKCAIQVIIVNHLSIGIKLRDGQSQEILHIVLAIHVTYAFYKLSYLLSICNIPIKYLQDANISYINKETNKIILYHKEINRRILLQIARSGIYFHL